MLYSIKQVTEKFHISPHTLRFYTDQDLIPGVVRDENNRRLFNDDALRWLKTILAFRSTGMSVKMIQSYLELYKQGDETIPERYNLLVEQQRLTKQQLSDLSQQLEVINEKVRTYYDSIKKIRNIEVESSLS
ncbi:hypothetical protein BC351_34155 [Paenibacillus ferrarius]|uniref:HTH merR-type domain-containing protein n=1 Tax=Paenibacillus ferrarius TaxID=1469647 RepID=A0A1V4HEB2_9BACL|nr:MerR family transcriptional regulator [Paenibacillus ferrarius]OPH51860.1 hypothetical protein BC351_34155 [Paenibacillus ferrarius]